VEASLPPGCWSAVTLDNADHFDGNGNRLNMVKPKPPVAKPRNGKHMKTPYFQHSK
jgi:hypothetical protein